MAADLDEMVREEQPDDTGQMPEDVSLDEVLGHHTMMSPHELAVSEDNPRTITDERFKALVYSLRKDPSMLKPRPIIATPDGRVVAGNMRLQAAIEAGLEQVPVWLGELSPARRREWMLRDNQEYGDWVRDDLSRMAEEHAAEGGDMAMLGFTEGELDDLRNLESDGTGDAGSGDQGEDPVPEMYAVIVECEDADEQAKLLEEFEERGLNFRSLSV